MKILRLICLSAFLFTTFSCKKDTVVQNDHQVGISKITYYVTFNLNGPKLLVINKGDVFTDPTQALENGKSVTFTKTGAVNTSTPGVYNLSYSATNTDGYSSSDWRTVVVVDPAVSANNFSGSYLRAATGVSCKWTKTATGVYSVDNPGGAATGVGYIVTVVNYMGNKIAIPKQLAADPSGAIGIVSSGSETYTPGTEFSWIFYAGGYGTSLRTFTKQ